MVTQTAIRPLTDEELGLANRCSARVRNELRALLEQLPEAGESVSAVARALGVERTTCHRVIAAVRGPDHGAQLLTRLPGGKALRAFIDACRAVGIPEGLTAGAEAAVEQYESTLARLAGSQQRLAQRLAVTLTDDAPPTPAGFPGTRDASILGSASRAEVTRRRLYEAAAEITGRSSEVNVLLWVLKPREGEERASIDHAMVHGSVRHSARQDAVPYVAVTGRVNPLPGDTREETYESITGEPGRGRTPSALIEEFCSRPLPRIVSRVAGNEYVQLVDSEDGGTAAPMDIFVGHLHHRSDHPALEDPPVENVWMLQHYPALRAIFDVWMHRDLARMCIPSLEAHLWRPNLSTSAAQRWYTQLPNPPKLELLGQGLRKAATEGWTRHADLVAHVFSRLSWSADEFVGFRCEVSFPIWRAGYCMTFDFTGAMPRKP